MAEGLKINRKLNLVIPIEVGGGTIYAHSTPIGKEVFEAYYTVIAKAFSEIYSGGLNWVVGPRVAAFILRDVAKRTGAWAGEAGVERGLVNEIRRLTNILSPGERGWETTPFDDAVRTGLIDEDDAAELDNAITFFTVASSIHHRRDLPEILARATKLWSGQATSLTCTEFRSSLKISTVAENTGGTAIPKLSSVPR